VARVRAFHPKGEARREVGTAQREKKKCSREAAKVGWSLKKNWVRDRENIVSV